MTFDCYVKDIKYPFQISMSVSSVANRNPEAAVGYLAFLGFTPNERQKTSVRKKSQFLDMLAGYLIHD